MKTSELTGKDLDYFVAKAQGWNESDDTIKHWVRKDGFRVVRVKAYTPSTNGGQCFELLTTENLTPLEYWCEEDNSATESPSNFMYVVEYLTCGVWKIVEGSTLNIAICRAFVASVYGEEVPDEQPM